MIPSLPPPTPHPLSESKIYHHIYRSTELGIYKKGCGMNNLLLAYGHDEYLYRVLVHNKTKIPEEGQA